MPDEQQNTNTAQNQEAEYQIVRTDMPVSLAYEMVIINGENQYLVEPAEAVKLTRSIDCQPAKLDFKVLKDDVLDFKEGNVVQFKVNNEIVFKGFVFEKDRDKNEEIRVLAYDQLRYLKNKDCYVYRNWTLTQLLQNIANDYGLTVGDLDNTQYIIPKRLEDNKTLADILMKALDLTIINLPQHTPYFIYDDGGKIMLKSLQAMKTDIYIDAECLQNYSYRTSIDKDTYNYVKVVREAPGAVGTTLVRTGVVVDEAHVKEWGRLQYLMKPDDKTANAMDRAQHIITTKNRKTRDIRLKGVIGDVRVRGGSSVYINLALGDIELNNYYVVQNVTHTFANGRHSMDMDVMYYEPPAQYEVKINNDTAVLQQIQEAKKTKTQTNTTGGSYTYNGTADPNQVGTAFAACEGRVSPYGSEGCVDTVCAAGSYYNADLKECYDSGVADTGTLCSKLESKGYQVESFTGYASKGDILLYGDRDHAVIADGAGGCFGNSSSNGYAMKYGDANYAWHNGEAPTEIIHMSR